MTNRTTWTVEWDNKTDQELIDEAGSPLERLFWSVVHQEEEGYGRARDELGDAHAES